MTLLFERRDGTGHVGEGKIPKAEQTQAGFALNVLLQDFKLGKNDWPSRAVLIAVANHVVSYLVGRDLRCSDLCFQRRVDCSGDSAGMTAVIFHKLNCEIARGSF